MIRNIKMLMGVYYSKVCFKIGVYRCRFCFWLLKNFQLGRLAPWVFGLAVWSKPQLINDDFKSEEKK